MGVDQPENSSRTTASGTVVQRSPHVPPVLDAGALFPVLATAETTFAVGAEIGVHGRLLVEPFHWVSDGLLWPTVPEGVRLWTVRRISCRHAGRVTAIDALPDPTAVDHDAAYCVTLDRP